MEAQVVAPSTLSYSASAFRRERESDWQAFDALISRLEGGSIRRLSDEELLELPRQYRALLSSLSLARATSLDAALVEYLEGLAMRGYFLLYGVRESRGWRVARFFRHDWPAAVRSLWKETLVMAALFALAVVVSYILVDSDPAWFASFGGPLAGERAPGASVETLRATVYGPPPKEALHVFATFLFTNNSQVSIIAYALGFAFGLPTMMLVFAQGLPLGAMLSVFFKAGLGWDFVAWLSIHGTTEIFAIFLAGGAGLRIGTAFAFPGPLGRLRAASTAGKETGAAMLGVIIMLIGAGLLEGFARQLVQPMALRFAIGGAMLAMWCAYFYLPRRKRG